VLAAVDLDDNPLLKADEIENEISERHLTPKLQIGETAAPQNLPYDRFGVGGITTHSARVRPKSGSYLSVMLKSRHQPLTRLGPSARATLSHKGRGLAHGSALFLERGEHRGAISPGGLLPFLGDGVADLGKP
jgi:hypothetical protein